MKKIKKLTSVFLAAIMALGVLTVAPFTASAAINSTQINIYKNKLKDIHNNPQSYMQLYDNNKKDIEKCSFSIADVNEDGTDELIVYFTETFTMGMYSEIWTINSKNQLSSLGRYGVSTDFYRNKYLVIYASHNQSPGYTIWPYNVYKYNESTKKYSNLIYSAYCINKGNNQYRASEDIDKDGVIYVVDNKKLTKSQYDYYVNTYIPSKNKINISQKKITNSNINNLGAPSSVKLNRGTLTLGVGEKYGLIKTVSPSSANQTCTWSSSNSSIASVDSSGKVTAKKSGTANITVKTSNGKTATCKVTVKFAPTSVKVNPASLTLGKGETYTISESTNSGSYAWGFSWSSSNTLVATVKKGSANKATVTAKGVGTATITIKTYNGKTAQCKVTVKNAPSSVKTNPASVTLGKGETYTISESTNSGTYANAANLKWTTSNSSVATVTKGSGNKATITAKGNGTAYIKISLYNGKTAQCKITVKNAPSSIKLSKSLLVVAQGKTATISENTPNAYANASNLVWSSSDNNIVEIKKVAGTNKAEIKAKNKGTTKITVKTYNGKKAECTVQVFGTTTKTITLNFNSLDSWKNEINRKERELVFGGNFATNPAGNQYYTGNTITGKKVLEYKTITAKVSLNTPGYYQTVKYKLPSKIKYTMHKHQIEKGYGTSWYIGAGSGTIVFNNNCNCGYHDEWSWEIPLPENNTDTPPDIGNGIEVVVYPKNSK